MPLYEFVCKKCNKKFEEICKVGINTAKCPKCGKKAEKILSMFGFKSEGKSSGGNSCSGCGSSNCGSCGH